MVLWTESEGEITQPRTGKEMAPWLPGEGTLDLDGILDRRELLVDWLVQPGNPFLARVEVNRIWANLMGRGIIDPFDDLRESNPPANQPLLDWLAEDFVENGFDRERVIRTILNSTTYQLSSQKNESNGQDIKYFSHMQPRQLPAAVGGGPEGQAILSSVAADLFPGPPGPCGSVSDLADRKM